MVVMQAMHRTRSTYYSLSFIGVARRQATPRGSEHSSGRSFAAKAQLSRQRLASGRRNGCWNGQHPLHIPAESAAWTSDLRATRPRTRSHTSRPSKTNMLPKRAFLAFGSNIGDAERNISNALDLLREREDVQIIRTSGLYKTKAMYVENQDDFTNGVCEIRTSLEPLQLLDACQAIENDLGRVKVLDKGPRNIDLDILLYDNQLVSEPRLLIPHKLMLERAFVLQPLCELIPEERPPPYGSSVTYAEYLQQLPALDSVMSTTVPLGAGGQMIQPLSPTRRTRIMSVLNITPDSFSDGGKLSDGDLKSLRNVVHEQVKAGATMFDVGGQSTRPNAEEVSVTEEIRRVIPAVRVIREVLATAHASDSATISVDTYRSEVARAAIEAGAHIINDVSAGRLDKSMLATAAALDCPVILMHMRGDPATMTQKQHTTYANGLIPTVAEELAERVAAAERAGIRRWRIILDPGIGFAKTQTQNLELLQKLSQLRDYAGLRGLPWLVGTSRKSFIGRITGVEVASERIWGTAAAVTAAVQGGADIVRVHDVGEMQQVVKMADAIWRV